MYIQKEESDIILQEGETVGPVMREFKGPVKSYISIVSVGLGLFELYTGCFGILDPLKQCCVFAIFVLAIGFIIYPFSKGRVWGKWFTLDIILSIVAVSLPLYLLIFHDDILMRYENITGAEVFMAYLMVFLFLELGRRSMGPILSLIALVGLFYALFGKMLPGLLRHCGVDIKFFANSLFTSTEGIWGMPMGVTAKYIYLFIFFGAISLSSGCGELIIKYANIIAGKQKGGPAKISIIASGFFGSISGSAVANVVTTGSFTIPMMKKIGFKPHFAAGVEAVASTGGVFMPPIMGSTAFIMAELMNVSYIDVIKAAFIPAVLYYISLFFMINFRSERRGLKGLEASEVPNFSLLDFVKELYLFFPLLILIYFMVFERMSPQKSVFLSIVTMIIILGLKFRKEKGMFFRKLLEAFESSAKTIASLIAAVAIAGIIMDIVMMTGLSLRISSNILSITGGHMFLVLILTMIVSLILGMGVTSSIAYIVPAILVVPVMIKSGFLPMASNLFSYYFATISYITPPVAIASFAAAGLAGADMFKTGYSAFGLGIAGFLVPYMFVFNPGLIMVGSLLEILISFAIAILTIFVLAMAVEGFFLTRLSLIERLLCFTGVLLLINQHYIRVIIVVIILLLIYIKQRFTLHKRKE